MVKKGLPTVAAFLVSLFSENSPERGGRLLQIFLQGKGLLAGLRGGAFLLHF